MANRADVNVKNCFTDNVDLNVVRKLSDGSTDLNSTITDGNEEQIHLPSTDVSLVVTAPNGFEIKNCPVHVKSDVDLDISKSRTDSNWTFQIVPNTLPPDIPTTVNVEIGPDEPD